MNVLVVGGAGFIGSHLTERLLADGCAVDVVDDLSTGSLANLAEARSMGGELKIHTLDAGAAEFHSLVAMRAPEVVYHLGLLVPGVPAEQAAARSMASLLGVLEAARATGTTKVVVALSAAALYGEVASKDQPIKESQPWQALGVRGVLTRSIAELLTVYREQHAVEFTALAMTSVYGARQRPDGGVVGALWQARAEGVAPTLQADGRQALDLLFIDDAVDALVRAAHKGSGLVVNIGTGVATAIAEVWATMAGPDAARPNSTPRRPDDVVRLALNTTRARIQLAWSSWTDLAAGIRALERSPR